MRSSIGAPNVGTLSISSRRSSPPAPSPPSPTLAYPSVCIRTRRPQASAQSWLKSGKARSASSAACLGLLTRLKELTPVTKLECVAIVWAVAKFRPYLMSMPFEVYTDHYALQWLKAMRTGSAFLYHWSDALEEYDFLVKHRPGKSHVDGLSRLPVDPPPPEDTLLQVRLVEDEEEARRLDQELHTATHLSGQALWKLFRDRYSHKAGRRICLETAQSCPQCQLGRDYGHRQKTTGAIQSEGPWYTLSMDLTLWNLCLRITARNSSSCLWIVILNIPSMFPPAITPQTRSVNLSCAT